MIRDIYIKLLEVTYFVKSNSIADLFLPTFDLVEYIKDKYNLDYSQVSWIINTSIKIYGK